MQKSKILFTESPAPEFFMAFRVGISSTFIEKAANDGVRTIIESVKSHRGEVPFILSTREKGEDPVTDSILKELVKEEIPLICVSTQKYRKSKEKDWRQNWGQEVLDKLKPYLPLDLVFLFGDMTIWPENMCRELSGVNLHPDLPGRFKGEWWEVIAQVVENKAEVAGVMMHLVTSELDKGPVVTYCHFSLRGPVFDLLWKSLPKDSEELKELIEKQRKLKEKPDHPLWQEIRKKGLKREFPLLETTIALFAEGKIRIEGEKIFNERGQELENGRDSTEEIEEIVRSKLEGQFSARKEVRD